MLVPEKIVREWYKPSSRVYKNFAYLFQNPLWNKSMPKGFSVCPYFWLSLFSMFVLRPFVLFITGICQPGLRLLGRPAAFADRKIRDYLPEPFASMNGMGFGSLLLAPVAILFVLFLLGLFFTGYHHTVGRGSIVYLYTVFGAVLGVACLIYAKKSKETYSENRAKVVWVGWLASFVLLNCVIFFPELWFVFGELAYNVGCFFKWGALGIWKIISQLGWAVWTVFAYGPFWHIPWIIDLAVAYGVLYLVLDKLFDVNYTPKHFKPDYTSRWETIIFDALSFRVEHIVDEAKGRVHIKGDYDEKGLQFVLGLVARDQLWQLAKKAAPALKDKEPVKIDMNNAHRSWTLSMIGSLLAHSTDNYFNIDLVPADYELAEKTAKAFHKREEWQIKFAELNARWLAAQRRAELCREFLDWIVSTATKYCEPLVTFIRAVCRDIARAYRYVKKTLTIFFSYIWVLIKAKKQNACPYIRFDENPKD